MRDVLATGTAMVLLLASVTVRAEVTEQHGDRFMTDMKETVYATNQHMTFSMRSSIIRWLGGVPIADPREVRAAERERWWGERVPLLPPEAVPKVNQ
jgi:hypothetical protein